MYELYKKYKKTIIWVDPARLKLFSPPPNWWWYARIEKRLKNKIVKKFLEKIAMGKLFYGGNWDLSAVLFSESEWIKNIRSLRLNFENFENSEWYKYIKFKISKYGFYKYKNKVIKNDQDIAYFFVKYFKEMILSLKDNGFTINKKYLNDIPKALIGRNGDLIKTGNGCHRLAIIQEFKIKCRYPIQIIGIHKKLRINGAKVSIMRLEDINKFLSDNYA
jgi:hypothetical protein